MRESEIYDEREKGKTGEKTGGIIESDFEPHSFVQEIPHGG